MINPDSPQANLCFHVTCSIPNTFLAPITADITSIAVNPTLIIIPTPDVVSNCLAPDSNPLTPALAAASAPPSIAFLANFSPT